MSLKSGESPRRTLTPPKKQLGSVLKAVKSPRRIIFWGFTRIQRVSITVSLKSGKSPKRIIFWGYTALLSKRLLSTQPSPKASNGLHSHRVPSFRPRYALEARATTSLLGDITPPKVRDDPQELWSDHVP